MIVSVLPECLADASFSGVTHTAMGMLLQDCSVLGFSTTMNNVGGDSPVVINADE